ncbi:MAG: alpha-N-acetylglucosaminidase [Bacteroidota bacterium]
MKRITIFLTLLFLSRAAAYAGGLTPKEKLYLSSVKALIERVLPGHSASFVLTCIPADKERDVFEITQAGKGKISLRGNNGVSLATAFNWYLRHELLISYDWQAIKPLSAPAVLPKLKAPYKQVCNAGERFFLNYCTYGYSFPFTSFAGWQRFFDWMAMNGINRPLMQCGQEATWLQVWKSYGMNDDQIRSFFTGPAHLPWHRMSNIDHYDGALPVSYINGQMEIQKKLTSMARAFGMKPVLSSFAGHVPENIKQLIPNASITQIHPGWGGFGTNEACWFLNPEDPLFLDIQKRFIKAQTAMYGTDHLYAADPFNEIDPPSWEPGYMAGVGKAIYGGMKNVDSAAIWYQMAWTFHYDKKWQKKSGTGISPLQALCEAIPKGKMVMIDYVCEEDELYKRTEQFYGASFLWDIVGNFGGNTYFRAPLHQISKKIDKVLPVANCRGIGCVLEGIDCNPEMYEMVMEQPWHEAGTFDDGEWIKGYAARRANGPDSMVQKAWEILLAKVLNEGPQGHYDRGSALTSKTPVFSEPKGPLPPKTALAGEVNARPRELLKGLADALDTMFLANDISRKADGYQYDVVNFTRQALAWYSDDVKARITDAFTRNDQEELNRQAAIMLGLIKDMDAVVSTRHEFLLGRWISDARAWGVNGTEADYYEVNARRIVTQWGGGLRDYARREWNGLLLDYYLPRWQKWAAKYAPTVVKDVPVQPAMNFELLKNANYATEPVGNPVEVATAIYHKYRSALLNR